MRHNLNSPICSCVCVSETCGAWLAIERTGKSKVGMCVHVCRCVGACICKEPSFQGKNNISHRVPQISHCYIDDINHGTEHKVAQTIDLTLGTRQEVTLLYSSGLLPLPSPMALVVSPLTHSSVIQDSKKFSLSLSLGTQQSRDTDSIY